MRILYHSFLSLCLILLFSLPAGASEHSKKDFERPDHHLEIERYELYPTQNMWTFLKLDTATGRIWQIHYSLERSPMEVILNEYKLTEEGFVPENKRFKLYPTQNIYNFILLDQKEGKVWQVQWSFESTNRIIRRIN